MASATRVDIWDQSASLVGSEATTSLLDRGYSRGLKEVFDVEDVIIGTGGFGQVRAVKEKSSGVEYACKSIKKRLNVIHVSRQKQEQHLANIDREIRVLKLLKGTLSVVSLKGVWEDDEDVHIVMEYCRGGELYHGIGRQPYTEERVSVYMRSVLQTLVQCHSQKILHRDIKPGNFLLLTEEENSPLKAVDFGLAAFYDPDSLPRTDLGLDGTPWFMAPEVLNSETYPASDVWSAGVMCYQLLSGHLPFDDVKNRNSPSLSLIWRAILTEELSFKGSAWSKVSDEAKAFVKSLLEKDHTRRPTAREALKDQWLQSTFHAGTSRTLDSTIVQRIQRFAQANLLQRTILELIASELVKIRPVSLPDPTVRQQRMFGGSPSGSTVTDHDKSSAGSTPKEGSHHGGSHGGNLLLFPMSPVHERDMDVVNEEDGGGGSHGSQGKGVLSPSRRQQRGGEGGSGSVHGRREYWRAMRQASDLILHGSGHRQSNYLHAFSLTPQEKQEQRKAARLSLDTSVHNESKYRAKNSDKIWLNEVATSPNNNDNNNDDSESRVPDFPNVSSPDASAGSKRTLEQGGRGRSLALQALEASGHDNIPSSDVDMAPIESDDVGMLSADMKLTNPKEVEPLMKKVGFRKGKVFNKDSLVHGLNQLGYHMESEEVSTLMDRLSLKKEDDGLGPSEFIASQLDWKDLQKNNKDLWIECAKKAFEGLDASATGKISAETIVNSLRKKLPRDEVDYAVEDAMVEAGIKDPEQVDFEGFLKMVTLGSHASTDSLDKYDPRIQT